MLKEVFLNLKIKYCRITQHIYVTYTSVSFRRYKQPLGVENSYMKYIETCCDIVKILQHFFKFFLFILFFF